MIVTISVARLLRFAAGPTRLTQPCTRRILRMACACKPLHWREADNPLGPRHTPPQGVETLGACVRTTEEIVNSLRGIPDTTPADLPDTLAGELDEPTPEPGFGPHSVGVAMERRKMMDAASSPIKRAVSPDDELRTRAMFSIIARFLAFNATNQEIVDELGRAGFDISERTLQRTMKRDDFKRFYEAFQGDINDRIVKLVREMYVLAAPEAYNHMIRLMRQAKSSDTQFRAAEFIHRAAGITQQEGNKGALHVHLPPEMAAMIEAEGRRITTITMKKLQTGPSDKVIDTVAVTKEVEDAPPDTR